MFIGEIGNRFASSEKIPYLSDRTTIDFDLIFVTFDNALEGISQHDDNRVQKRLNNLNEFLEHRKTPFVVFVPKPRTVYFHKIGNANLDFFLPIPNFTVASENGNNINIVSNTIFTNFLNKYSEYFFYDSYFEHYEGTVIAEAPFTKKVLAFYNEKSVFIPKLKESLKEKEEEFLKELFEIVKKISGVDEKEQLPNWANKYYLPNEKRLAESILNIKEEISRLQNELAEKAQEIEKIDNKKILFTGTGNDLENEIENIFKELGFEILETDRNRDDLIVQYKEKIAVVEIKGVNGTSGERHSNQLEKWVTSYYDKHEIRTKGILIVNSFREKELMARVDDTFPNQMLDFASKRDHCLISSLQFLGLYYSAITQDKKDELIESLFNTIGVYKGFEDWKDFIET